MNAQLKAATENYEAQILNALDLEEHKQARIQFFVDELLGGQKVITRVNLKRVQLTYSDVEEVLNDMCADGEIDPAAANINLIRFHFGDGEQDIDLLNQWKENVHLAAFKLIGQHYNAIIEEAAFDAAA